MSTVRTFLLSESPIPSGDHLAEARQGLAHQATFWGYGPLTSVAFERAERGEGAHVEESDGTPVDVSGQFLLHFVGRTL